MTGKRGLTEEERFWAKVDRTEGCWNWTAATKTSGYGVFENRRAHRIAYTMTRGEIPGLMQVDHLCHNRACVNPGHLRLATFAENSQNRKGATVRSKSGHRGVFWHPQTRKWRVVAVKEGVAHQGGYFSDPDEAAAAATALRASLYAKAA